jgi:hypothetical protein
LPRRVDVSDIIHLKDHICVPVKLESDVAYETFLLEEGLDVLAAYRSIEDKAVRLSLKALIEAMSRSAVQI